MTFELSLGQRLNLSTALTPGLPVQLFSLVGVHAVAREQGHHFVHRVGHSDEEWRERADIVHHEHLAADQSDVGGEVM